MSVNWLNFRKCLSGLGSQSAFYTDKGSEIPIKNESDFQKAILLAKMNKKQLKIILYYNEITPLTTVNPDVFFDNEQLGRPLKAGKTKKKTKDLDSKTNKCQCNGINPPEWFAKYMKKFKKGLLHELKSSLHAIINNSSKKNKKMPKITPVAIDIPSKNETILTSVPKKTKKKKKKSKKNQKKSKKNQKNLNDQREVKLAEQIEKLHSPKFESLEKLDNKMKEPPEEKEKLIKRKRRTKSKTKKNNGVTTEKEILKKSASFHKKKACLFLSPGEEFLVNLKFTNDGMVHWESPYLECFEVYGLYPQELRISLPRLLPMESSFTTLRGKVSEKGGLHYFKCRLFDGLTKFGPEFLCLAWVEVSKSDKTFPNSVINAIDSEDKKGKDSIGMPVYFDKDEVSTARKKIEENINEIERRLKKIDLLRSSAVGEENLERNQTDEFRVSSCGLLQNLEKKENGKEKLEKEGVHFGVDCLRVADLKSDQRMNQRSDENETDEKFEKLDKNGELESSSDSELSLIFMSEEDDNFVVVPLPTKSPSPAESVNGDKSFVEADSEWCASASQEKTESTEKQLLEACNEEYSVKNDQEVSSKLPTCQRLPGPLKTRRPPIGEEISKSKPKKIKPSSTEYHFTAANLTQPNFTQSPKRFVEGSLFKFTSTGEKEEKKSCSEDTFERCSKSILTEDKAEKKYSPEFMFEGKRSEFTPSEKISSKEAFKRESIRTTDEAKKIIYAVNSSGYCLPVNSLLEYQDHTNIYRENNPNESSRKEADNIHSYERRQDGFGIPLPKQIIDKVSNIASIAFDTADSVINNLHSVFAVERKTESWKPACEDKKKVSAEALLKLLEMGFTDFELNKKLLLAYENNIPKIVDELVQMKKDSSQSRAQFFNSHR